jgi:hypothetical protein
VRLAFDFTPKELVAFAFHRGYDSCLVTFEGTLQSETQQWSFRHDVRRVYARCRGKRGSFHDTILLEIYYTNDRPKLELKYYSLEPYCEPSSQSVRGETDV